jgi:hypothetical protein
MTETSGSLSPSTAHGAGPATLKTALAREEQERDEHQETPSPDRRIAAAGGVGLLVLVALIVLYAAPRSDSGIPEPALGSATVDSHPPGAEVVIDGELQGITPLSLALPAGQHLLEVRDGTTSRSIPLMVEAGTLTAQYVELAPTVIPPATGRLEVTSDPPGAQVVMDGAPLGTTPLILESLDVGEHEVSVSSRTGTVSRAVTIEAGATATVMVSLTGAASAAGWVVIQAPIELQILEGGQLLGATSADQMMLPAGTHDLELVSQAFEFRTTIQTRITPGGTTTEVVDMPNGSLSINALPWADVYIDGEYAGTTPLGNVAVAIGSHDVVWRHPELGERRGTVSVPANTPARIGVDFSQ